jgi:hypothetical protein
MSKKKTVSQQQEMVAPIEWRVPEGISTPFATNMIVQLIENEFKLSFFEVKPPLIFDYSTTRPSSIVADCVGSVIITADRLPKFIEALQSQLNMYQSSKQKK